MEGAGTLHCKAVCAPDPEGEDGDLCAQSCPTLCDPVDRSLPSSSPHGIFQARILDRVAISFLMGRGFGGRQRTTTWLLLDFSKVNWKICAQHLLHHIALLRVVTLLLHFCLPELT